MNCESTLRHGCAALAAGALLTMSSPALSAEQSIDRRPLSWHVDAGYVMTDDETSDFLDPGWMLEGGLTWRPYRGPFGLRADLRYLDFDLDEGVRQIGGSPAAPARVDDGDASIVGLNLGGTYDFQVNERFSGYVTAGLGPYYRDVELTQTVLFSGVACDPFFGVCFRALTPGEITVADTETTRLGWSVGIGMQWPLQAGALFLEGRYLRIETDEATELVPVQFGFRF